MSGTRLLEMCGRLFAADRQGERLELTPALDEQRTLRDFIDTLESTGDPGSCVEVDEDCCPHLALLNEPGGDLIAVFVPAGVALRVAVDELSLAFDAWVYPNGAVAV